MNYLVIGIFLMTASLWADSGLRTKLLNVSLFGSKCELSGPKTRVDPSLLKSIHSISPAQIHGLNSLDAVNRAIENVNGFLKVPKELESYIENLKKHLSAVSAFYFGIKNAQKSGNPALFKMAIKPHLPDKLPDQFEKTQRNLSMYFANKKTSQRLSESLFEIYADHVEPVPEREFHSAIRRMDVSYHCAMEEKSE